MRHLTATLIVVGILIAGCRSGSEDEAKTSTTTSTTKPPLPVLLDNALPPLLLSPEEINAAMGTTEMAMTNNRVEMSEDSALVEPKECLAIDSSAQQAVYAGSRYTTVRDQTFNDGDNFTHYAEQAVVLFPTAKDAGDFITTSAQQWPACHEYSHPQSGTVWRPGPISNANGIVSVITIQQNPKAGGWACGRALAARNNVVVDVNTCSANPADTAVKIAGQIAARVQPQ
ncbi:MAG: sensor domain-containing protein [Candidatus Sericytochromatia bacterium]